ncbi:MAG: AAA family ATPase [Bernardetiaceae bacterium]|nr:AAA family ATPase [Bernardetiaceae bacterium]
MLIKRIKAKNFKTYLDLDIDLTVIDNKPIILIGGKNGGGKTTLFEAIYGALYGLNIKNNTEFLRLVNMGTDVQEDSQIVLEIHFSGQVLHEEVNYVLKRTYMRNVEKKVNEAVDFNMDGQRLVYGTAMPIQQRAKAEEEVSKIIKANLPEELSRYFLFDAMQASELLQENKLLLVIKENIENVMGFNKYSQLARVSETILDDYKAQQLKVDKEKQDYLSLLEQKKEQEQELEQTKEALASALRYATENLQAYQDLQQGFNHQNTLKERLETQKREIETILQKEKNYRKNTEKFIKDLELFVTLPKLQSLLKSEIALILERFQQSSSSSGSHIDRQQLAHISQLVFDYLQNNERFTGTIDKKSLQDFLWKKIQASENENEYSFLESEEISSLKRVHSYRAPNPFPDLQQEKRDLDSEIRKIPEMRISIDKTEQSITGSNYNFLKTYKENELKTKEYEAKVATIERTLVQIKDKIQQFDIQHEDKDNPKFEVMQKLKPLFDKIANRLLAHKKKLIEETMRQDLNINLAAYRDMIDRVELSENLANLTFKIFHKHGNEISLTELNTASKQVVVQVLLKSLHKYGDYNPPVMIDTVMGVLDKESRTTLLENYFPSLSHQTILLSSDSEIEEKDIEKIAPFISRAYTLERQKYEQCTHVKTGYFNSNI